MAFECLAPWTLVDGHFSRLRRRAVASILALWGVVFAGATGAQTITEFPIALSGSVPSSITAGPDGNLWFTQAGGIGRMTTAGVVTGEFPYITDSAGGVSILTGPDGNVWFAEFAAGRIGRITTAGVVTEFPIPTGDNEASGIAVGMDGNLWFTEQGGDRIGQITPAGVVNVEFLIPTANSFPIGIAAGPDGNLWFVEEAGNNIARLTIAGGMTEFPVPTASSLPFGIAAGVDGNLWFTEQGGNKIGRITTAGVITEFPIPTAGSSPWSITAGADGNLWFTEYNGNQIGRITTAGVITEFPIATAGSKPIGIAAGPDGNVWFTESNANKIGRIAIPALAAQALAVDAHAVSGDSSNHNGVLESGETVQVAPSWTNNLSSPQTVTGSASNLTGPAGPTYILDDASAAYGSISVGATSDCFAATSNCFLMTVSGSRPAQHWDATFAESLDVNLIVHGWVLHVGESFPDVPKSQQFYTFIENLFHNGITAGCAGGNYCPGNPVTRAQMAVFLLKGEHGSAYTPPVCSATVFTDEPCPGGQFVAWVNQLASENITGGCGGGNYCPGNPVTRGQMSVFLLKAEHGGAYSPPACSATVFADVVCPGAQFVNFINQLAAENITGGCGGGNYCPGNPNNRGQMAVFLVKTFGLQLYRP